MYLIKNPDDFLLALHSGVLPLLRVVSTTAFYLLSASVVLFMMRENVDIAVFPSAILLPRNCFYCMMV
jgi:hypothetical protein